MEEQKVIKESFRNGNELVIASVLPQGSETGFWLVRRPGDKPINEPLMARKIMFELMDGTLLEGTVNREPPADTLQGMEWQERIKESDEQEEDQPE